VHEFGQQAHVREWFLEKSHIEIRVRVCHDIIDAAKHQGTVNGLLRNHRSAM